MESGGERPSRTSRRAGLSREPVLAAAVALDRHRWAVGLLDARPNPGEANLRLYESALACLCEAGFSEEMAGRARSIQAAYCLGSS